jgi:NAD-dependent dihydropyrimidine dehydrogenase PreA subunit
MSFTIVSDICEGVGDCFAVCPVDCIFWVEGKTNVKGTKYAYIDGQTCIGCNGCLSVCPIEGAILDEWIPELQKP